MAEWSLSHNADMDLESIWIDIARHSPEAATRFLRSLEPRFSLLAENPRMGRSRPELGEDLRSFPVGSFLIIYTPVPSGVEIVRVVRGSRDIEQLW